MAVKTDSNSVADRTHHSSRSQRLAKLVKLLDINDAALLILVFHYFPDELLQDLKMIEVSLRHDNRSAIHGFLQRYDRRNWTAANGDSTESIGKEKHKLATFERSARRMEREASADKREPFMRDDIPF